MNEQDWPPTMRRGQAVATRKQMHRAFCSWRPATGYHGLSLQLMRDGVLGYCDDPWRLADAMIQRARRKGAIRLNERREWERVE